MGSQGGSRRGGRDSISSVAGQHGEPSVGVATAYEAASKALPMRSVASLRELFEKIAVGSEVEGGDAKFKRENQKDFTVLLLLLHDRLSRESAAQLKELVHRAEQKGQISVDEFRDAVRDARLLGVDDGAWRPFLLSVNS